MFGALLFTFLPTALVYLWFNRTGLISSGILRTAISWFLGQYLSTFVIFLISIGLVPFTPGVLAKASGAYIAFLILCLTLLLLKERPWALLVKAGRRGLQGVFAFKAVAIGFCLAFSVLLFNPQLAQMDNAIYTSPVYWDFNIHFPTIQSFVYGDNFPPENESFSGVPMTYHYYFYLLMATYASLGMGLVGAINYVSIMTFFVLLLAIVGFCEEVFGSWKVGFLAALLSVTSSSLRFFDYFRRLQTESLLEVVPGLLSNNQHPFFFSFVPGNPFGYNGTMFNIFYFVAERHLVMGTIFLIFGSWLLFARDRLSTAVLLGSGVVMGLFFQWHLFITISVFCAVVGTIIFGQYRGRSLMILSGFSVVCLVQSLYLRSLLDPAWFYPEIHQFPKINFGYPTMEPQYPLSWPNAVGYYVYAYGLKVLLAPIAIALLWKEKERVFPIMLSVIVPTFILVNSVQLSPLSVYDNHKWLRPMNVILDIAIAYALWSVFFKKLEWGSLLTGAAVVVPLVLSGFIELMPFINSRSTNLYAFYPAPSVSSIRENSEPKSSFLSEESKELHLAGRKVYLLNPLDEPGATSLVETGKFNQSLRRSMTAAIYDAKSVSEFCRLTLDNRVDFVEFNSKKRTLPIFNDLTDFPRFEVRNENGEPVLFVNVRKGCPK